MTIMTLDPIAARCAELVNSVAHQRGEMEKCIPSDFNTTTSRYSFAALYQLVSAASRAVSAEIEDYTNRFQEPPKALLALKVPHAGDLMQEAFLIALKAEPGLCRASVFRAELAKRHIGVFIDSLSYSEAPAS